MVPTHSPSLRGIGGQFFRFFGPLVPSVCLVVALVRNAFRRGRGRTIVVAGETLGLGFGLATFISSCWEEVHLELNCGHGIEWPTLMTGRAGSVA